MDEKSILLFNIGDSHQSNEACGDIMTNHVIIKKISRTLPSQFDHMVEHLKQYHRLGNSDIYVGKINRI